MAALSIAANNGDVAGGEMMQLALADAARDLGVDVQIVGMRSPGELVALARAGDHRVVELPADGRRQYARALREWWRGERQGVLWCNGLVPAVATTGLPRRVIHLHRAPDGLQWVAARAASLGALETFVPSHDMARRVAGATVLSNWTANIEPVPVAPAGQRYRVGFLGRTTLDKGIHVLAAAIEHLGRDVELVVGGETRFANAAEQSRVEDALAPILNRTARLGWVSRERFFGAVDVAVFPSVWAEPFGLVVAEAMAATRPFVISDAGALLEVAGDQHPWVARRGDPVALAATIRAAREARPDELAADIERARRRWTALYSPEAGRARFAEHWARLANRIEPASAEEDR